MTRDERLELIAKLQEQADAGREEIARRQAAREADPEWLREDVNTAHARHLVTKENAADLTYKTVIRPAPDNEAPAPAFTDEQEQAIAEFVVEFTNKKLKPLQKRIADLETKLKGR